MYPEPIRFAQGTLANGFNMTLYYNVLLPLEYKET